MTRSFRPRLAPLLFGLVLAAGASSPLLAQSTTVIRGGQLFDATDTTLVANPGLVVRAGKIVDRGETALDTTGARTLRLDSTQVILPGFIDLHAHYAVDFFDEGRVEETEGYPLLYLANGATITAYGYYGTRDSEIYADWPNAQQYLTPYLRKTLSKKDYQEPVQRFQTIFELKLERIEAFYEAGAGDLITLGTDHPSWGEFLAPFGVHRELQAFVRAGIPEGAALRIATINGARALGLSDRLGTVEVGKWADLVVIDGNPLADIRHTRTVEWVMVRGTLHRAEALREAARGTVGPKSQAEVEAFKPDRQE